MIVGSRAAAIAGVILALPFAWIFTLLSLHIEPPLGPLRPLATMQVNGIYVVGTGIVLGAWLLALVAFIVNIRPVVRARDAWSRTVTPINLVVAVFALSFVVLFIVGIVVDQYPCWTGVPNCD